MSHYRLTSGSRNEVSARWRVSAKRLAVGLLAGACALLSGDHSGAKMGTGDEHGRWIRLEGHQFDPLAGPPALAPEMRYERPAPNEDAYFIVQFNDRITQEMRRGLERAGMVPLHYIHDNAFLVRARGDASDRAAKIQSVRWAGRFEPA